MSDKEGSIGSRLTAAFNKYEILGNASMQMLERRVKCPLLQLILSMLKLQKTLAKMVLREQSTHDSEKILCNRDDSAFST